MLVLVTGLTVLLAAAPAFAVLDNPPRVSRSIPIQTVFGTCNLGASADAAPSPAGVGRVTSAEWADCGLLSSTPSSLWLTSTFGGLSVPDQVHGPGRSEKLCRASSSCSMTHTRTLLPPGDYTVHHRIGIDLTQGSGSQTYFLGYPSDCRITASDSGDLVCSFEQRVTYLPKAPSAPLPAP